MPVNLRSDTFTQPSGSMRIHMANAPVGDDVFGEDPTVRALEEKVAVLLKKEAALFVPSGHMSNQIALNIHGRPGDSIIAHRESHVLYYETGSPAVLSGLDARVIDSEDGTFGADEVRALLKPVNIHFSRNRILSLENTFNNRGGVVWDHRQFWELCIFAREQGLKVHLDGARLWNACHAARKIPSDWTQQLDSVSVCFSKGLGAPVGSALAGTAEFIEEARHVRKRFGGQMRQAGIIAAGAIFALDNNYERIGEDHANARLIAEIVNTSPHLSCPQPPTNMALITVDNPGFDAHQLVAAAAEEVQAFALHARRIRCVTHLDVTEDDCRRGAEAFVKAAARLAGEGN
ncbi:MAG: GntG family PLP-dependent aldolase [bacterium]